MNRATSWILVACVSFASLSRAAEPTAEEKAMAETLFFTGRGLMEAERYPEACQKFAESYRLAPAAGTFLNLAVCHEKEGKLASAWAEFKQALIEAKKMGRADREELATERLAAIEPDLPYLAIDVPESSRIAGLEVLRNGSPLFAGSWGTELPVDPGEVVIVTRAPGHQSRTTKLMVDRKQHLRVAIEPLNALPSAPNPPSPAPLPAAVAEQHGWTTTRTIGFTMLGLGVAATALGGYYGIRAANAKSDSDDACPLVDGERRCSEAGSARMLEAKRDAWFSNIGIGVGVLSVAVGSYLFVKGARTEPRVAVTPTSVFAGVSYSF